MEPSSGDAQRAGLRVTILAMGTRGDVQPLAGEFDRAAEMPEGEILASSISPNLHSVPFCEWQY
jgi:hypothetical protein